MPTVRFIREGLEVECEQGANLRQVARKADIKIYEKPFNVLNCHGFGNCGTCRVMVEDGQGASEMSLMEKLQFFIGWPLSVMPFFNFFDYVGKENELRLSCQIAVENDMVVRTRPAVNFYGQEDWEYELDNPAVAGQTPEMEPPTTTWEEGEVSQLEQ